MRVSQTLNDTGWNPLSGQVIRLLMEKFWADKELQIYNAPRGRGRIPITQENIEENWSSLMNDMEKRLEGDGYLKFHTEENKQYALYKDGIREIGQDGVVSDNVLTALPHNFNNQGLFSFNHNSTTSLDLSGERAKRFSKTFIPNERDGSEGEEEQEVADQDYRKFCEAIQDNNLDLAKQLIRRGGFDVNWKDYNGNSLLHVSAFSNAEEFLNLLVNKGANINAQNNQGDTPAHLAFHAEIELADQIIFTYKANPTIRNNQGLSVEDLMKELEEEARRKSRQQQVQTENPTPSVSKPIRVSTVQEVVSSQEVKDCISDWIRNKPYNETDSIRINEVDITNKEIIDLAKDSISLQRYDPRPKGAYQGVGASLDTQKDLEGNVTSFKFKEIMSPEDKRFSVDANSLIGKDLVAVKVNGQMRNISDFFKGKTQKEGLRDVVGVFHDTGNIEFVVEDQRGQRQDISCNRDKKIFVTNDCKTANGLGAKTGEKFNPNKHNTECLEGFQDRLNDLIASKSRPKSSSMTM